jgi:hypothetical protein
MLSSIHSTGIPQAFPQVGERFSKKSAFVGSTFDANVVGHPREPFDAQTAA